MGKKREKKGKRSKDDEHGGGDHPPKEKKRGRPSQNDKNKFTGRIGSVQPLSHLQLFNQSKRGKEKKRGREGGKESTPPYIPELTVQRETLPAVSGQYPLFIFICQAGRKRRGRREDKNGVLSARPPRRFCTIKVWRL